MKRMNLDSNFNQYHNVSVRLNESDYKQLTALHENFNKRSYGKVSLADVLRVAVSELHLKEFGEQVLIEEPEDQEQTEEEQPEPEATADTKKK